MNTRIGLTADSLDCDHQKELINYCITQILHSTGIEFKQDLEKAKDLDQIIAVHNKYVNTIHERCLLHKMVKLLKQAVMNVLNLILNFQALWDEGIHEIRWGSGMRQGSG